MQGSAASSSLGPVLSRQDNQVKIRLRPSNIPQARILKLDVARRFAEQSGASGLRDILIKMESFLGEKL